MPSKGLTPEQQTQVDYARTELSAARSADLAALDSASLVMQVERLRSRLDDTLQIIDDLTLLSAS